MTKLVINTSRDAYSIEDIRSTLTAAELIEILSQWDEDTPVYLSFDNGYTYGGLSWESMQEEYDDEI